jgi:hypothetical protein
VIKKQKIIKFFESYKTLQIKMIPYKLENSDEKIQISSLEELRKKDIWNALIMK